MGKPYICRTFTGLNTLVWSTTVVQPPPKEEIKFAFNIIKIDQIFDHLLKDQQINLSEGHKIPSIEELRGKKYCKQHNRWSHITNKCPVFHNIMQKSIMEGRLKFSNKDTGVMLIDGDSFPEVAVNVTSIDLAKIKVESSAQIGM